MSTASNNAIYNSQYTVTNIVDLKIVLDQEPYVLIDMSASTSAGYNNIDVLTAEKQFAHNLLQKYNILRARIMFWNNCYTWMSEMPIPIDNLLNYDIRPNGSTILAQALHELHFDTTKVNDLYIFTDGEIQDMDSMIEKELQRIFQANVRVHICAIETSNTNYIDDTCGVGTPLPYEMYFVISK